MANQLALSHPAIAEPVETPDVYNLAAQRLKGMPEDWQWFSIESKESPFGRFTQVTGAVPVGFYSRGPRKGRTKWPANKDCQVFQFTPAQLDDVMLAWEAETGNCFTCGGDGQEQFGWSKAEGRRYRQCSRCGGTGKAPQQKPVESGSEHPTPSAPQALDELFKLLDAEDPLLKAPELTDP
jgi:hypothetical protein